MHPIAIAKGNLSSAIMVPTSEHSKRRKGYGTAR